MHDFFFFGLFSSLEHFVWRWAAHQKMIDVKAWAEYVVEWAAKDPYGFLTTVILALTPLFIASALLSWKLAKMIEVRDREQKKKQKRQENIAKAKRAKKDWTETAKGCRGINAYVPVCKQNKNKPPLLAMQNPEQLLQGLWVKRGFETALSLAMSVLINWDHFFRTAVFCFFFWKIHCCNMIAALSIPILFNVDLFQHQSTKVFIIIIIVIKKKALNSLNSHNVCPINVALL